MLCSEARVNIRDIRDGRLTNAQWAGTIMDAGDRLSKLPIFIDETPQLSAIEMRQKARRIAQDHEVNCIVIDYLQLMRATGVSRNANREQEVSKLSSDIKAMAKDMDVPVLLLAQLNRQAEQGGRPKLSQLRESGAIEQDADVVMLLHRDRDQAIEHEDGDEPTGLESEVIIAKNRNGETGIVKLMFIGQYTRFENATRIADEDVPLD
jgi:replicative DNA helicase